MPKPINNWNPKKVKHFHNTWGQLTPPHIKYMFDFCLPSNSFLDLGCGFGRFLKYLLDNKQEPFTYTGYDASSAMLDKIKEEFPNYKNSIHLHDVTKPFNHKASCIIISAVFIHLLFKDQLKVLDNIVATNPDKLTFDIDRLKPELGAKKDLIERVNKTGFRSTRQSSEIMNSILAKKFPNYNLTEETFLGDTASVGRPNTHVFTLTRNDE